MLRAARARATQDVVFPAPVKGWVRSGNITTAAPDEAEVLDNFFPTAQGARLRGGSTEYADIGAAVVRMMAYQGASADLFAATASGIYDCDRIAGGGAVFADVAGLSSGDWSATQISTSAGDYMVAVNGTDYAHYWNNSAWNPIAAAAINTVSYDALTADFAVGETVTGGISGASATILSITQTSATEGVLKLGAITSGPFQDNEALTDGATGAATAASASAAGSSIAITGIATTSLTQVWNFKERLFFVEKDSLSVWYLPTGALGGAATEIDLGAVFRRGGKLLFGATWSLDSGAGIDDVCLFVTDQGEIAVYEGTDPSSATTWALAGVYDIAPPFNKHSHFKAGGDVAILTADGIIPASAALRKDRAALQADAVSYPIEDAWKEATDSTSYPVNATLWQSEALLLVGVEADGDTPQAFVANARTGAWCRYTGWDVRCSAVSANSLYFATNAGKVMKAEASGQDDGAGYTGCYVPKFQEFGVGQVKIANHAGLTFRASGEPVFRLAAFSDYEVGDISAPTTTGITTGQSVWGTGTWGVFVWGSTADAETYTRWAAVRAAGYSLAPAVKVTANTTAAPTFEILATRLRFETGNPL